MLLTQVLLCESKGNGYDYVSGHKYSSVLLTQVLLCETKGNGYNYVSGHKYNSVLLTQVSRHILNFKHGA